MKKPLIVMAITILVVLTLAAVADAHTPTVRADCGGVHVELVEYEPGSIVTATVTGPNGYTAGYSDRFDSAFARSYPVPGGAFQWTVTVDNRGDGPRDQWDQTFTDVHAACRPATTTTSTTTTVPWVPLAPTSVPVMDAPPVVASPAPPVEVGAAAPVLAFTGADEVVLLGAVGLLLVCVGVALVRLGRAGRRS